MAFNLIIESGQTMNISSNELSWRLVHNGNEILFLDKVEGVTHTKYSAYQSNNFKDIINYISSNNLNYHSIQIRNWDKFYDDAIIDLSISEDGDVISLINSFHPNNWTLVYDDSKVIYLTQQPIKINSGLNVYTSTNIEGCFDKIQDLNLIWDNKSIYQIEYPNYFQ